ncbi:class I SAM-dependent methyltransferase [Chitinophaga sp. XS-30]|uniref:class I SAM-dependent methyltransferase n=1 Tax=Chitinophaga sp. XS-30 TaxID=2604421 RepID=UPI0011DCBFB0|nr:class I SAM-dependent methyltransferase [Chitinophaga sp. XS-30]QEH41926.1 methyltransferase domain-containing protein [Chitinophaga sp. XS-30]
MNKDVRETPENGAADYEEHLGPLIFEPAAKELLSHIVTLPAHSILEVACGTGRVTRHLRESFPAATRLVATDINTDMLDIARQQLNDPSISFQVADAQQLPFADHSFDLVVNQFGLMFLPEKQTGVNEAFRVLKPGGHFVFATWDRADSMPLTELLLNTLIIPVFKGEDTTRFCISTALHDPAVLNTYLENAGFQHHRVMFVSFKGHANSPQQVVNSYFLKHPLGRAAKEKEPADFDRIANELEEAVIQRFGTGAFEFELRALVGIGRKVD